MTENNLRDKILDITQQKCGNSLEHFSRCTCEIDAIVAAIIKHAESMSKEASKSKLLPKDITQRDMFVLGYLDALDDFVSSLKDEDIYNDANLEGRL